MQNCVAIRQEVSEISAMENLCSRKNGPKFTKVFQGMLLIKAPNQPKFCHKRLKNVEDIRNQKFVLAEKVDKNSPKLLNDLLPPKAPIMPNFIEIGETTFEKSVTKFLHPSIF